MEKTAREVIASGDVRAAVDYAIELNRRKTAQDRELDEIKKYLREVARGDVADSGVRTTEIVGNLGTASVVFERPAVKTRKDMALADIEENLSEATFARLFVSRVVIEPSGDFLDKLPSLTSAERATVENFLEVVPTTPKVYLPK